MMSSTVSSFAKRLLTPPVAAALLLGLLVGTVLFGLVLTPTARGATGTAGEFGRPYPLPHQYWARTDEFYVFASGGQQGGLYV